MAGRLGLKYHPGLLYRTFRHATGKGRRTMGDRLGQIGYPPHGHVLRGISSGSRSWAALCGAMRPARAAPDRRPATTRVTDWLSLGGFVRAGRRLRSGGRGVEILLRPDDVLHDDASPMKAQVVARAFRGAEYLYTLRLPSGTRILCLVQSHHDHAPGEMIGIRPALEHLVAFPLDLPREVPDADEPLLIAR